MHLPGTGDTYKDTPRPASEKFCPLVIHAKSSAVPPGRGVRCPPLPTARILQLWGGGVKATVTLQPPFKDVPFSGAFPSGSHTKGSTTQRDDGAGWHDWAGKPREAAGGLHFARTVPGAVGLGDSHEKGKQRWSCVTQLQEARSQSSSDISSCGSPHHGIPQRKRRSCQVWLEPAASGGRTG